MAQGRSLTDFERVYIGGYDMSGYTSDPGEMGVDFARHNSLCLSDAVQGALVGKPDVTFGPLNGVFDNTATSGLHVLADAEKGTTQNVMLMRGVREVPAVGNDAFCGPFLQTSHMTGMGDVVTAKLTFEYDANAGLNYDEFFGNVAHLFASETGANAANTPNINNGAASAAGGWMMYQIRSITGAGNVTISLDDSANGTAWAALSGATSGAIATASAPTSGIVQLAIGATVRQYLRHQIAFGASATACTFALAFMRGR